LQSRRGHVPQCPTAGDATDSADDAGNLNGTCEVQQGREGMEEF